MTHKRADKQELGKLFLNIPVLALIQKQIISPHNKKKKKKIGLYSDMWKNENSNKQDIHRWALGRLLTNDLHN